MSVFVVVGGQYGSEGKAKVAVRLAMEYQKASRPVVSVRCGGPNAGHTVYLGDQRQHRQVLRQIPSGVAVVGTQLVIAAGSAINVDLLLQEIHEIEALGVPVANRLAIDSQAALVTEDDILAEQENGFAGAFGSTQTGTGAVAASRCYRRAKLARSDQRLAPFIHDRMSMHLSAMRRQAEIIVEGTQGFGLSLFHSGCYPFCTSKDTTAAAFLSEAGLRYPASVVMVVRTFPIRVGGNSGPIANEIDWPTVATRCNGPDSISEMTSVTHRLRRVGEFDWDLMDRAVAANGPAQIAVHGADYINWADRGRRLLGDLSDPTMNFLKLLQRRYHVPVTAVFTGPHQDEMVWCPDGVL